jgi:NAD+ kinase
MKLSKIGVISHPRIEAALVSDLVKRLEAAGVRLFFDPVTAKKVNRKKTEVADMRVDLALVFGGDGTILWVVKELRGRPLLLGVNTGKVGYLAETTPKEVGKKINLLLSGKFLVDERMCLSVGKSKALNEAFVASKEPATLLEFRIRLDGIEVAHFRADGVMVATPTGSTGYSLSAGGPILHPAVGGYIITPSNPFLRGQFPLVVPEDAVAEIELVRDDRDANLILDGQVVKSIRPHQKVAVKKSSETVRFVRFSSDFKHRQLNVCGARDG